MSMLDDAPQCSHLENGIEQNCDAGFNNILLQEGDPLGPRNWVLV